MTRNKIGRPRQHPGIVSAGEQTCRRPFYNGSAEIISVCQKPVPAGELPHLAWNDPSGEYLALCLSCRNELSGILELWFGAGLGTARLVAELMSTKSGELVSERTLRQLLVDKGHIKATKRGPLSAEDKERGMTLFLAAKDAEWDR